MNLAQLLAANPSAQSEYNAALATARTDGEQAGAKRVEDRIAAAAPFLNNEAYGASVSALAVQVMKGEESQATLKTVVTVLDAQKEQKATTAATTASTTAPATPAAPVAPVGQDGVVADDAGLEVLKAQMKGGN